MFCTNCGKEIKEGAAFCVSCGAMVPTAPTAPETSAAPSAPEASAAPTAPETSAALTAAAAPEASAAPSAPETPAAPTAPEASAAPSAPAAPTETAAPAAAAIDGAKKTKKEKTPGKKKGKGGLIVAIVLIVLAICIGVGSALYFTGDNYKTKKYLKLANACYEDGEYDDALDYYEKALELDSTLQEAYLNSADIYLSKGDYKKAVNLLNKAIKNFKDADDEEATDELVDMLTRAYLAGIEEELDKPDFKVAHKLAKNGLDDTGDKVFSKKQVEIYVAEADYYMQSNDYYGALDALETGYEATEDEALLERRLDIYKLAADNYLQDDYYSSALFILQTGYYATDDAGLKEKLTDVYLAYAEFYAAVKDYDMAIQILSEGQAITGAEKLSSRMDELIAERNPKPAVGGKRGGIIDPVTGYTIYIDPATGQPYDLGGADIVIRDWYSPDWPDAPKNDYEIARQDYRDWIQKTYNFTIRQQGLSGWSTSTSDFMEYVYGGWVGDSNLYAFILPDYVSDYANLVSAMNNGFMYDLSTLNCLDFSEEKFTMNKTHEKFSKHGAIYGMNAGYSQPTTGIFFNKRLLREAGIDPETIYDMQAAGTWTWDAWTDIMDQVQRKTDAWGFNANNYYLTLSAIYSNGGELVGKDASGNYTYRLEDAETMKALEWAVGVFKDYMQEDPYDADWDYYLPAFFNGECAFMIEAAYRINSTIYSSYGAYSLESMSDDWGFVMFPKGPYANDYTNCSTDNLVCIPACYSEDEAWKIAFAWNLYTDDIPGYEGYPAMLDSYRDYVRGDERILETLEMMGKKSMVTYYNLVPDLNTDGLFWNINRYANVDSVVANIRDSWKSAISNAW